MGRKDIIAAMNSARKLRLAALAVSFSALIPLAGQSGPEVKYQIYAGSTHAHTSYTWSHGDQFTKTDCQGIRVYGPKATGDSLSVWTEGYVKSKTGCYSMYVINSFQLPSPDMKVKADWEKSQGLPIAHFLAAKAKGFEFYVTSDHSQETVFSPISSTNPAWMATKKAAVDATDADFVGIPGFEFSENDGPGGTGHINVLNSDGMINALLPGVDLEVFYKWLPTAKASGGGPVVASFNHPDAHQYADFSGRTAAATDVLTMLEVINSNNKIHYEGFLTALDKGWKVSPVAGNDNHGLSGIQTQTSRTFVLATSKTRAAILDAMKHRRTYASLDNNIQCRYTVNGQIMGSTLPQSKEFRFAIDIKDPDTANPKDKIMKIDIVKDGGVVVETYDVPEPGYSVVWSPTVRDSGSKYFFVRVWNAGGGDAPGADPAKPIAWLAPVWTGR
jgi:hypothetical protein